MRDDRRNNSKISWFASNLKSIQQIAVSIMFIGGLGYASIDWLGNHFITKLEASNYALKSNVMKIDHDLAKTQIFVLENELYNARREGIQQEDKQYLRTLHKRIFVLKIKLKMIQAKEEDYRTPIYLREK